MNGRLHSSIPQAVTVTQDQIIMAGANAIQDIPDRFNRKQLHVKHEAYSDYLEGHVAPLGRDYNVGDKVVYSIVDNMGNKKWPDLITLIHIGTIEKLTDKMALIAGIEIDKDGWNFERRIDKGYIIGVIQ